MPHGLHEADQVVGRSPPFESNSARRARTIGSIWADYMAPEICNAAMFVLCFFVSVRERQMPAVNTAENSETRDHPAARAMRPPSVATVPRCCRSHARVARFGSR